MRPLNILKDGTRRIADGDLEWELDYHNKDEFGEVCGEFDRMRGHLKESVETRIQYEQYRRELIAGISHDLRTPLTSIKGYTEGYRMELPIRRRNRSGIMRQSMCVPWIWKHW